PDDARHLHSFPTRRSSDLQKWLALAKLKEGENSVECQGREGVVVTKSYSLTEDEAKKVKELQAQIDAIIEAAKARYVAKPKLDRSEEHTSELQSRFDLVCR